MKGKAAIALGTVLMMVTSASGFEPTGVGGGGWLHSGAFHPSNKEVILIGGDPTCGIVRTDDFGQSWRPWNEGIPDHDESFSMYTEDLAGVLEQGSAVFYAATHGGIFRRPDATAPWAADTPASRYCYRLDNGLTTHALPIPFSCLAWDGGQYLYAGAGRVRWDRNWDTIYYPGIAGGIYDSLVGGENYSIQFPVWRKDLEGDGSWLPFPDDTARTPELGTPRDISVATVDGEQMIAICTPSGIFLYREALGEWLELDDLDLEILGIPNSNGLEYGNALTGWSIHLTARGSLYVAMERMSVANVTRPSGIYMIQDVTDSQFSGIWHWVGNDDDVDPWSISLFDVGMRNTTDGASPGCQLIYLSVIDGTGDNGDILYVGDRVYDFGLLKGTHGSFSGAPPYDYDWEEKVYSVEGEYYYTTKTGRAKTLDVGWLDIWSPSVIFHPVIAPSDPNRLLVQFNGRLHVSSSGGNSWDQCYDSGSEGSWVSTGYNELCVRGLDFMSDGRLVLGNGDCGTFRSLGTDQASFQWLKSPMAIWPEVATGSNDYAWTAETAAVHVRADYLGGGQDALFVNSGDIIQMGAPGKLFMVTDDPPIWNNITASIEGSDLGPLQNFLFGDFTFSDDQTIFAIYNRYSGRVGDASSYIKETGVLRGSLVEGQYLWERFNQGLLFTDPNTLASFNAFGSQILFNEFSDKIYLAGNFQGAYTPEVSVSVRGALYAVDPAAGSTWSLILGGLNDPVFTYPDQVMDFRCLAQSADGHVLYAGTRGRSIAGIGTVLKCVNPTGTAADTWTMLANETLETNSFGFLAPFWSNILGYYKSQFYNYPGRYLTDVRCLAVDPVAPDVVYAGLCCDGFMSQEGLWSFNIDGSGSWEHLSSDQPFVGMGVQGMGFNPASPGQLVFGTEGQGAYFVAVSSQVPMESDSDAVSPLESRLSITQIQSRPDGALVRYTVPQESRLELKVFDVRGRLVFQLWKDEVQAGIHEVFWNGRDESGRSLASGVYFLRMSANGSSIAKGRIVLVH